MITLTLTSKRQLVSVESEDFRVKLNGRTNADYKKVLESLGVRLVFQSQDEASNKE